MTDGAVDVYVRLDTGNLEAVALSGKYTHDLGAFVTDRIAGTGAKGYVAPTGTVACTLDYSATFTDYGTKVVVPKPTLTIPTF